MSNDLIDQALQAERLGRFDEAREKLRQAIAQGEASSVLDVRLRLGKLLVLGGGRCFDEAMSVLTEVRKQAEQEGARRQAAMAINLLALLEKGRGNLDEATRLLEESPALKQVAAPGPPLGQYFHYRGLIEAARDNVDYAERLFFRAPPGLPRGAPRSWPGRGL